VQNKKPALSRRIRGKVKGEGLEAEKSDGDGGF